MAYYIYTMMVILMRMPRAIYYVSCHCFFAVLISSASARGYNILPRRVQRARDSHPRSAPFSGYGARLPRRKNVHRRRRSDDIIYIIRYNIILVRNTPRLLQEVYITRQMQIKAYKKRVYTNASTYLLYNYSLSRTKYLYY